MTLKRPALALVAALALISLATSTGAPAWADATTWPVQGPVIKGFDPPSTTYGPGHRGIDIAAPPGTTVVAPADGVATFVGVIDHVPIITLTHADGIRTTYQPVTATIAQGAHVVAGQAIGVLLAGHGSAPSLHFGVLDGTTYLDPLAWLGGGASQVRLLPDGATLPPGAGPVPGGLVGAAGSWPVKGSITSGYGWRLHPILHKMMFHDGIDIGAPCGTPVASPWAGVVSAAGTSSTMGRYVKIAHPGGLVTTYMHLSVIGVSVGQQVAAGQQIGNVGTTGRSTGCHLHFGTAKNGRSVNPLSLLA